MSDGLGVNHPNVINIRVDDYSGENYVYIGRKRSGPHYGNPFSHLNGDNLASVIVGSREMAVQAFEDWLEGRAWRSIEPERRLWIIERIHTLKGKILGCYCDPELCHGTVLAARADISGWQPQVA